MLIQSKHFVNALATGNKESSNSIVDVNRLQLNVLHLSLHRVNKEQLFSSLLVSNDSASDYFSVTVVFVCYFLAYVSGPVSS